MSYAGRIIVTSHAEGTTDESTGGSVVVTTARGETMLRAVTAAATTLLAVTAAGRIEVGRPAERHRAVAATASTGGNAVGLPVGDETRGGTAGPVTSLSATTR